MAANDVVIQLTARDGASNTFKTVGREAQNMGKTIDTSAKTSESSLTRLSKAGAGVGAAFGALSGVLSDAARINAEAEASQARLNTAIEDSGHFLSEYSSQLDEATKKALQLGFDDEDAADSIAKLTTATGDANVAISDLSIAEDLARARKIDLASATNIVIAAEQGRIGALKRVGIEVDATMSKEQVMDALRAQFAGNAEAYAATSAGSMDRVRNAAENALQALGAHLGPMQTIIGLLPGLQAGYVAVSAAIGALIPVEEGATAGAVALDLALGPVGLALAAVGAGIAIYKLSGYFKDDFVPSADSARSGLDKLNASLNAFIQASSPLSPLAKQTTDDLKYITDATANYQQRLHDLSNEQEQAQQEYDTYSQIRAADTAGIEERRQKLDSLNATLATLRGQQGLASVSAAELTKATESANAVLNDTGPAGEAARNQLKYLDDSVQDGTMSWVDYLKGVNDLAGALPEMNLGMIEAAGGVDEATAAALKGKQALTDYTDEFKAMNVQSKELNDALPKAIKTFKDYNQQFTGIGQGKAIKGDQFTDMADGAGAAGMALADETRAQNEANAAADAATQKLKDTEGAYYSLRDGVISANDAHAIFNQTQDGIVASQGPYNKQLSDYNTQLGYINDAVDILNKKKADGITLTKDEQGVLDGAASAQERLQGGTDDATVALAAQAEQYAANMKVNDEMNQKLGDQNSLTGELNTTIQNLILALQGIPGYVSTYIDTNADQAKLAAEGFNAILDTINGKQVYARVYVDAYGPGIGYQNLGGGQLGGVIEHHAMGGGIGRNGWSWVGEAGPELIYSPGAHVLPHTASMATTQGNGGGGGGTHYHVANLNVYANDPRQFSDSMRSFNFGYGARS